MDNPLSSALQKMGSNFLVAAFVPAMAFIVVSMVAFRAILPFNLPYFGGDLTQFIQINFVLLLLVVILGFTLFSLRTFIYKSFEGYTFILEKNNALGRSFFRRQEQRFKKIEADLAWIEKRLAKLNEKIERESYSTKTGKRYVKRLERYAEERKSLYTQRYNKASEKNENYPPSFDLLLPTRFGNLLRAAEMYPGTHYAIDAVPLWGRLSHVIPEEGMGKIDEADNQCLFLLNATFLTVLFTLLSIFASAYQGLTWWAAAHHVKLLQLIEIDFDHPYYYQEMMWLYLVLALLAGGIAWFFYNASLLNVTQFGGMIRSSYDLYRFDLLEALHLELPSSLRAEKMLWRRLSYFMAGNEQGIELNEKDAFEEVSEFNGIDFPYRHPKKQKNSGKA